MQNFMRAFTGLVVALLTVHIASGAETEEKKADAAPTYAVIPVKGIVGFHFTDEVLQKCLRQAEINKVSRVVLEIDSSGGSSEELEKITQRLVQWQTEKGVPIDAYINTKAYSAAAIIAVPCKNIFMARVATIGATSEIGGTASLSSTSLLRMKRDSVLRAQDRALAQFGEHDPGIVLAMFDPGVQVFYKDADGSPKITSRQVPMYDSKPVALGGETADGVALNDHRKLLTLTAADAVRCGFAKAIVANYLEIGAALELPTWKEAEACRAVAVTQHRTAAQAEADLERLSKITLAMITKDAGSTVESMTRRMGELRGIRAMLTRIASLIEKHEWLAQSVDQPRLSSLTSSVDREISRLQSRIESARPREKTPGVPGSGTIRRTFP